MNNQANKNRMVLLLILGIPLTMVLTATWLWYYVVQGDLDLVGALGTANKGTLVQPPRLLEEVDLYDQQGAPARYSDLERRWSMLVPSSGDTCTQTCEYSLYITRQIHVAMGKEFPRLQRIYVSDRAAPATALAVSELSDGQAPPHNLAELLEREHRGLRAFSVAEDQYSKLFSEYDADPATWYLVDPAGWIMMSYNSEVNYKDVISDLKFLLKNSSE